MPSNPSPNPKPDPTDGLVGVTTLTGFEAELTYSVPARLAGRICLGSLVRVPLGKRQVLGVVTGDGDPTVEPERLRSILHLCHEAPVLPEPLVQLHAWMVRYYAATTESAFETMIPAAIRKETGARRIHYLEPVRDLSAESIASVRRRAPKQAVLLEFLAQQRQRLPRNDVLKRLGVSPQTCAAMVRHGLITETSEDSFRAAYEDEIGDAETVSTVPPRLTEEQGRAVSEISELIATGEFAPHLLHGVTGSGKTEVYLHAIEQVLAKGGGVLFLVPEVALTPQTVARVRGRLSQSGEHVVVWHSHLSDGERRDAWLAIMNGSARVVVGARSAVFAPIRHLRLIIVDEEHEPSYKQAEKPRYHGRDVAVYRAMLSRATCVLGSATPALETLYNVSRGQYSVSRLLKRVDDRKLPKIVVVDMKLERPGSDGPTAFSRLLIDKLHQRLELKEQAILFLNRRGWSKNLVCGACGHVIPCPHCSTSLTYHRADGTLKCHLCGFTRPDTDQCPACGKKDMRRPGFGTQRIEEQLARLAPRARAVRLDRDSMSQKHRFRRVLSDFRSGRFDVLIGTQMIAKGLDFPNVTLVGILDADISLQVPDFRAGERAFQLLVQVAGRAGRGDLAGEVVVQTFLPHSDPILFAKRENFTGFLEAELEERKQFHYPPFQHVIRHIFRGRNAEKVAFCIEKWADALEANLPFQMEMRGPVPCPLEKTKDHYRFHLLYFTTSPSRVVPEIQKIRSAFPLPDDVADVLDVDAIDMV